MLPANLKPEQFSGYPPEARKLAIEYLGVFQRLPLSFLPNLLREVIDYDYRFPAERKTLEKELGNSPQFGYLPNSNNLIGSILRRNSWNNFHRTSGLRTSWTRFARQLRTMRIVCTRRCGQIHLLCLVWGLP